MLKNNENEHIPPSHGWVDASAIRPPYPVTTQLLTPSRDSIARRSPHVSQPHNTDENTGFGIAIDSLAKGGTSDDRNADEDAHSSSTSKSALGHVGVTPVPGSSLRSRIEVPMMLPPPPPPPRLRRPLLLRPKNPHDWPHGYNQRMDTGSGISKPLDFSSS